MTSQPTLVTTVRCGNALGEGVLWDDRNEAALWTDIEARALYRSPFPFETFHRFDVPERLCSFGLPRSNQDRLIAAFESGFALFDWRSGDCQWVDRPALPAGCRFNDGRVDRSGVFWAGTMVEDSGRRERAEGALFRLSPQGQAEPAIGDVQISNGLCWSPDGTIMYFADTPRRLIWAFDFDAGRLSNRRVFAETPPGAHPDGSTVDADGGVWNAQWGAGRVVRYTPDGEIDCVVGVPAPHVTCVAFGGPHLDHLLVTSACAELSDAQITEAPDSGSLFVYRTPYRGLPEARCAITAPGPVAD